MNKRVDTPYNEIKSPIFWMMMAFVVGFMLIAPFYKGLFNGEQWTFEGPIYRAIVWSAVALGVLVVYFFKHWKLESMRDVLSLLIWLVPFSYFISLFNAASHHTALNGVYIHVMYAVFFLIGLYFTQSKLGLNIILHAILGSGYILVIYGFLNWFGVAHYMDAVLNGRLSNVFQYPNTYAAYLIALFVATLYMVSSSKKWYTTVLYALALVPIFTSFLLTLSRSAYLIVFIVLIIYLCLLPWYRQFTTLIITAFVGVGSLIVLPKLTEAGVQTTDEVVSSGSMGFVWLVGATIAVAGMSYLIQRYADRPLQQRFSSGKRFRVSDWGFAVGILLVTIGVIYVVFASSTLAQLLPQSIQARIGTIDLDQTSLQGRLLYYEDAMKLIQDHLLMGTGAGGWASLYDLYKSLPYTSRQAHNFLLQQFVETGLLGFILLLVVIGLSCWRFIHLYISTPRSENEYRVPFFVMWISIALHSVIDFDMSFVYIGALFFLVLGAIASGRTQIEHKEARKIVKKQNYWRYSVVSVISIIAVMAFWNNYQHARAYNIYKNEFSATVNSGIYNDISQMLDQLLRLHPSNITYQLQKINILSSVYAQTQEEMYMDEAIAQLNELKKREPYNRAIVSTEMALQLQQENIEQAIEIAKAELQKRPWDLDLYEKQMEYWLQLGLQEDSLEDAYQEMKLVYDEVMGKREKIDSLPQEMRAISQDFLKIYSIYYLMGKTAIYLHDSELAEDYFRKARFSNDFTNTLYKEIARWYLATLMINGKMEQQLYDLLIMYDSEEEQRIQEIITTFTQ